VITGWRAEPRTTPGGQPWYSPLAILTALTLKAVFRLALRQAKGLIGSIIGLLGLALAVPDHSILSRRAKTLGVPRSQPRRNGEAMHRLVDSTGLRLCGAGEWLLEEAWHQDAPVVAKLHIGLDAETGQIAASLTAKEVDDGAEAGPLLDQITGAGASFTGDGGYDQDRVYADVAERHPEAAVVVPPRATAVPGDTAATAPTQRDRHLQHVKPRGLSRDNQNRVAATISDTSIGGISLRRAAGCQVRSRHRRWPERPDFTGGCPPQMLGRRCYLKLNILIPAVAV